MDDSSLLRSLCLVSLCAGNLFPRRGTQRLVGVVAAADPDLPAERRRAACPHTACAAARRAGFRPGAPGRRPPGEGFRLVPRRLHCGDAGSRSCRVLPRDGRRFGRAAAHGVRLGDRMPCGSRSPLPALPAGGACCDGVPLIPASALQSAFQRKTPPALSG